MQPILVICLILSASTVVHVALIPYLRIFGVGPDLILVTVSIIGFLEGQNLGAISGFLGGLLQDLAGSRVVGLSSLTKTITGYLAGSMKSGLTDETALLPASLVIFFSFFHRLIYMLLSFLISQPIAKGWAAASHLIIGPLYDALLAIPVFLICRRALVRRSGGDYVKEFKIS
ncbi:MAG: rod shape-determining protein MreD [Actinomycetota bacterium]|nr:rod shape-determining protein MreD [Actinomycetota bacterium]